MAPTPPTTSQNYYGIVLESVVNHPMLTAFLAAIGSLFLASAAFKALRVFFYTFLLPGTSLKKFGAGKGSWAVVTGATDGIGREFALQLAKAGFNILLASRSPEKLGAVAGEIEALYGVATKTQPIDFAKEEHVSYDALSNAISSIEVGVLVNNVGKSYDSPSVFDERSLADEEEIVKINIVAQLRVTKMVLPQMRARKNGLILNIGSFSGAYPTPMLSVYSGTKSFLSTWTQALAEEMKEEGVLVELVNTYFVVSTMSKFKRPALTVPLPSTYVKSVLSRIGVPCGALGKPHTSTPYWTHAIIDWALESFVPRGFLLSQNLAMHKTIRKRVLRKKERLAKAGKTE